MKENTIFDGKIPFIVAYTIYTKKQKIWIFKWEVLVLVVVILFFLNGMQNSLSHADSHKYHSPVVTLR